MKSTLIIALVAAICAAAWVWAEYRYKNSNWLKGYRHG